jgi:hypothetical protein
LRYPYKEEVADHFGLESCIVAREDRGEALTEECVGRAIELRNAFTEMLGSFARTQAVNACPWSCVRWSAGEIGLVVGLDSEQCRALASAYSEVDP